MKVFVNSIRLVLIISLIPVLVFCVRDRSLPVVGTTSITEITKISAFATSYVIYDGGSSIKSRGICWDSTGDPTIANSKLKVEGDLGPISGKLTNLWPGTLYYVRAFATNKVGTAYSRVTEFNTPPILIPKVMTRTIIELRPRSAITGVTIINDNGGGIIKKGVCWGTEPNPTLSDNSTYDGFGPYMVYSYLRKLNPSTTYYVRAYAINTAGIGYGNQLTFTTYNDSVMDIDNNIYYTTIFGNKEWTISNMKATRYNNGDLIGTTTLPYLSIESDSAPKFQWAYGGDDNRVVYEGRLYTWYTITDNRKFCPVGYHVPTDGEWTELINWFGGDSVAGEIMKQGARFWHNLPVTNDSGFKAYPAGMREPDGTFLNVYLSTLYWSSSSSSPTSAFSQRVDDLSSLVIRNANRKSSGFSVRCIKDY